MTPVEFVILGMATWRSASLLVRENGPFHLFRRMREGVGITHDDQGKPLIIPDGTLAGILSCVWCCSMWTALLWLGLWLWLGETGVKLAMVFALSAAAIWLDGWIEG